MDTLAPVTKGSLLVTPGGRIRVDMRRRADSLGAWLRGGRDPRRLRVRRLDSAHFTIRVPAGMARPRVLDLLARYPRGDGAFGARLRIP